MTKTIHTIAIPFLFVWELPQNLLGLVLYIVMRVNHQIEGAVRETNYLFLETPNTGVSLGWFIFWTPKGNRFPYLPNDCRMHEYGHARQSSMLGPFYLLVVGVPSLIRAIYSRWFRIKNGRTWTGYFNEFPENWADKLGGVVKD
jgi:hypothetical protein